ncbi:MAG: universal stress protein, partial [Candidatus Tectomicrobia bacterium]|nr:universal stress protein [Candidatus Tectomicrobia bacterium]
HGRSGVSRLLMGSVTESVIRGATVPVLVVRAAGSTVAEAVPSG